MDLTTCLKRLNIGEPTTAAGLKAFPLYPLDPPSLELTLLGDALAMGAVRMIEAEGEPGAWFRRLSLENLGGSTILVRDGDLLLGGKQDRAAERSCVVVGNARTVIPTVCVEQGGSNF